MHIFARTTITVALVATLGLWTASAAARPVETDQNTTARSARTTMERVIISLPDGTRLVRWVPVSDPQNIRRGGFRVSAPLGMNTDHRNVGIKSPLTPTSAITTTGAIERSPVVHGSRINAPEAIESEPQTGTAGTVVFTRTSAGIVGNALPPPEQIRRWNTSLTDDMLVIESPDGTEILKPNKRTITGQLGGATTIKMVPIDSGLDLHITITNDQDLPIELGRIIIGGFRLGQVVKYRDFRYCSKEVVWDNKGTKYFPRSFTYPFPLYSPVAVFGNDSHTFGVSLLYPMLEYEHGVTFQLATPGGGYLQTGLNWELRVKLDGELEPGQTRQYTLTIRATTEKDDWLRTLTPYQIYFQDLYGGVTYARDPRPIRMLTTTQQSAISNDNPYGFAAERLRPDYLGWKPTTDWIRSLTRQGYQRTVIWTPTGLYQRNRSLNMPFQFMTQMNNIPMMKSSTQELRKLAQETDLGFWWGRSVQVSDHWDPVSAELLDHNNPEHVRLAFAELDEALALGANMIGLDAFVKIPPWESLPWLQMLRERAPGVKFCAESYACDVIHRNAATFVYAHTGQADTPKHLADFLLPGNETWAYISFNIMDGKAGRKLTAQDQEREIRRVAELGFVPLVSRSSFIPNGPAYHAAEGWNQSVPPDLRTPVPDQTP